MWGSYTTGFACKATTRDRHAGILKNHPEAWPVSSITVIYGPVGSNVAASSYAWTIGEPLHITMDSYNNGLLCASHRQ